MTGDFEVSLDNCHKEPIHIPGSIQPHGYLLVLDPETLCVRYFSKNLADIFKCDATALLGVNVAQVLSSESVTRIHEHRHSSEFYTLNPLQVSMQFIDSETFEMNAVLSRCQGNLLVELEQKRALQLRSFEHINHLFKHSLYSIVESKELSAVFEATVREIRSLTSFDRVMLYKFDQDYNGEVIAESKEDSLNSFLRQHFPESDIPKQARALYLRNPIRLLANVDAKPSPIYPQDEPVDLSSCILRSVSPIHCQYLRNMGVRASMSISIIIADKLWGLIACHHYSPHIVPFEVREAAQYAGLILSYLTSLKVQSADELREAKVLSMNAAISELLSKEKNFVDALRQESRTLMDMFSSTGVAWRLEDEIESFGETPNPTEIDEIFTWAYQQLHDNSIYHTNSLSTENPEFSTIKDTASGILVMPVSITGNLFIVWFRKEVIQTKNWGGKPEKSIEFLDDGSHRLMPRSSFELWKENVRGKSEPWLKAETLCGLKLRNTLVNYVLEKSEGLHEINSALEDMVKARTEALQEEISVRKKVENDLMLALKQSEESNRELERFAFVASHDLQEPLRKITSFGDRIRSSDEPISEKNASYLERMVNSADRMQTLIKGVLSFSRINHTAEAFSHFDGDELINETLLDLEVLIADKEAVINALPIGQIYGDRRQIQRLMQNLINNALKFSKPKIPPRIEIKTTLRTSDHITLAIRDNGIGFDNTFADRIFNLFERLHGRSEYEGTGLGLAICKKIVERHHGKLTTQAEEGKGATFFLTLPLHEVTSRLADAGFNRSLQRQR